MTTQNTQKQVNLPSTPCSATFSGAVCGPDIASLNSLDGFSVNPRTMVCFSAAIDPTTLSSGIRYLPLDGSTGPITINQIFYDPASNCAFAKPNQVLRQQTQYLIEITDSIHDASGQPVVKATSFTDCLADHTTALSQAVTKAGSRITGNLVDASVFTTMSATTWLEKAGHFVNANEPPVILPAGLVTVFKLSHLDSLTWFPQDNNGTKTPTQQSIPLSALSDVDSIAFGLFLSPNFLDPTTGSIPTTPTGQPINLPLPLPGVPAGVPAGYVPVSFHVFLPSPGKSSSGGRGFPVVIYGHGLGDNQFGAPTYIASTLASRGFATLAFEITGHGYGPGGFVQLADKNHTTYTVAAPGRGIVLSSGPIGATDGCILPGALAVRDCGRQTALDLIAVVRALIETHGMGYLDPTRIYYVGQSFGSTYGTLFNAIEPAVNLSVLNGAGGTSVDVARLALTGRPLSIAYLRGVNPVLLNVPIPGVNPAHPGVPPAPQQDYFHDPFNDNYPYRDVAPVVNNVPVAPAIQAAFETAEWLGMLGDPLAFAPHLKLSPLAGVPAKSTLFQFGLGDLEVPNPTESALVNAAGGLSNTWLFRTDIAAQTHPELLGIPVSPTVPLPILPHRILSNPTIFSVPAERPISLAEQQQVADFFSGNSNPDPNGYLTAPFAGAQIFFNFSSSTMLPEMLNFLQIPR